MIQYIGVEKGRKKKKRKTVEEMNWRQGLITGERLPKFDGLITGVEKVEEMNSKDI